MNETSKMIQDCMSDPRSLVDKHANCVIVTAVSVIVGLFFITFGIGKLIGDDVALSTFEDIGWGHWFRYVAGIVELVGGFAIILPSTRRYGAMALFLTMCGAVFFHIFYLGINTALAAVIAGTASAFVLHNSLESNDSKSKK